MKTFKPYEPIAIFKVNIEQPGLKYLKSDFSKLAVNMAIMWLLTPLPLLLIIVSLLGYPCVASHVIILIESVDSSVVGLA